MKVIKKIISGGQTGVDRAALDVALKCNIPIGGWCPKGRRAEDGVINSKYPLKETKTENYVERTRLNVQDSNGTLILNIGELSGGTELTVKFAHEFSKPVFIVDLEKPFPTQLVKLIDWLTRNDINILNIAGPRENSSKKIYSLSQNFLILLYNYVRSE